MMVTEADAEDRLAALADDEVGITDAYYENLNEHGNSPDDYDEASWFNGAKWAFAKARAAIAEATLGDKCTYDFCGHKDTRHIETGDVERYEVCLDCREQGGVAQKPNHYFRPRFKAGQVEEARRDGDECDQCGLPPSAHIQGLSYVGAHAFKPPHFEAHGPSDLPQTPPAKAK